MPFSDAGHSFIAGPGGTVKARKSGF